MSRIRLAAVARWSPPSSLGSGAAALAAWPLTADAQAASQMASRRRLARRTARTPHRRRVPDAVISSGLAEAIARRRRRGRRAAAR
jgi:hypothetical protein